MGWALPDAGVVVAGVPSWRYLPGDWPKALCIEGVLFGSRRGLCVRVRFRGNSHTGDIKGPWRHFSLQPGESRMRLLREGASCFSTTDAQIEKIQILTAFVGTILV